MIRGRNKYCRIIINVNFINTNLYFMNSHSIKRKKIWLWFFWLTPAGLVRNIISQLNFGEVHCLGLIYDLQVLRRGCYHWAITSVCCQKCADGKGVRMVKELPGRTWNPEIQGYPSLDSSPFIYISNVCIVFWFVRKTFNLLFLISP